MTDNEIIRIATQDASGLTAEAQEIIKIELTRRKLDLSVLSGIDIQNREPTFEEIERYCELTRNLTCPFCGTKSIRLNGTMTSEVVSMILVTQFDQHLKIACPDCLDKFNKKALVKTILFGWWGIPWGPIRTIQAVVQNLNRKKTNRLDTHNKYLRDFVVSNVGQFATYEDQTEKLQQIVSNQ